MSDFKVKHDPDQKALCDTVERLVGQFIKTMVPGHRYTLETMCGNAFWDRLTHAQRRKAGHCITRLIASGKFDLDYGETGGKATKPYQLK